MDFVDPEIEKELNINPWCCLLNPSIDDILINLARPNGQPSAIILTTNSSLLGWTMSGRIGVWVQSILKTVGTNYGILIAEYGNILTALFSYFYHSSLLSLPLYPRILRNPKSGGL